MVRQCPFSCTVYTRVLYILAIGPKQSPNPPMDVGGRVSPGYSLNGCDPGLGAFTHIVQYSLITREF